MAKASKIVGLSDEVAKVLCWIKMGDESVSPDTLFKQMRPKARRDFRDQADRLIVMLYARGVLVARAVELAGDRGEGVVRVAADKVKNGQWRIGAMLAPETNTVEVDDVSDAPLQTHITARSVHFSMASETVVTEDREQVRQLVELLTRWLVSADLGHLWARLLR